MPENSEQPNLNPESNSSEQELNLEQQGQQLAAQIKDMHAKAQTKEDYEAVQKKIAELREMFEVAPNANGYYKLADVIDSVYKNMESPEPTSNWRWSLHQPRADRGDSTNLYITMGMLDPHGDLDKMLIEEGKFDLSNYERYSGMKTGISELEKELNGHKVKALLDKSDMSWGLEVEPQPFKSLREVLLNVNENLAVLKRADDFPWAVLQINRDNKQFIRMNTVFTEDDNVDNMDFADFWPSELEENNISRHTQMGKSSSTFDDLRNFVGDRKVRSYNVHGEWFLELEPELEPEAEVKSLVDAINDTTRYLEGLGIDTEFDSKMWSIDLDENFIDMKLTLPDSVDDYDKYFRKATTVEAIKINNLQAMERFNEYLPGYDSLPKILGYSTKVESILRGKKWYLKIIKDTPDTKASLL